MSLQLMKERMKISGMNVRDEEIRDAIFIEEVEKNNILNKIMLNVDH